MPKLSLDDIFQEEDELGLLEVKAQASTTTTEENRIRQQFEEINMFIDRHARLPGNTSKPSVSEKKLQLRLNHLRSDSVLVAHLTIFDRHRILVEKEPKKAEEKIPESLDDIFEMDDDILSTTSDDIFEYKHARPPIARPDKIAEREACKDFDQFKPLFNECARDIETGKRKTFKFTKEQEIEAGQFFILNGVLAYVAEVRDPHIRNGKRNARLRVIFDNGTEGNNLLRSLATELYKDPNGRRVQSLEMGPLFSESLEESDVQTGMIYVVKSLSNDPRIKELDGFLFKIGFTSGSLETRIHNAKDDPTFLMAPVHPIKTYSLYNIDKVKLENLLHRFFADARLNVEIMDRFGKPIKPREWFLLSIDTIDEAIARLKDSSIIHYRYDAGAGKIVRIG